MKIHNKLEITKNKEKYEFYNSLSTSVFDFLENLDPYNKCFAFGDGKVATSGSEETLSNTIAVIPSVIESYNFNPNMGRIFVSKQIDLQTAQHDDFSFSEVGICKDNGQNPKIANRFLIKNEQGEVVEVSIKKGDEAIVKITTYLELDESSKVGYFDIQSPFFAIILGIMLDENGNPVDEESLIADAEMSETPEPTVVDEASEMATQIVAEAETMEIARAEEVEMSETSAQTLETEAPEVSALLGTLTIPESSTLSEVSTGATTTESSLASRFSAKKAYFYKPSNGNFPLTQISDNSLPVSVTIEKESGGVNILLGCSVFGETFRGVVIYYNNKPCFFVNSYDLQDFETVEYTGEPTTDGSIIFTDDHIFEVVERVSILSETSEITSPYNAEHYYGLDYGETINNPFGEMDYSNSTKQFFNAEGTLSMYLIDGRVDMYYLNGVVFQKIDTTAVQVQNLLEARIVHDLMIVRYYNAETEVQTVKFYLYKNLKMYELTQIGAFANNSWVDWDACDWQGVIRHSTPHIKELYVMIYAYEGGATIDRLQVDANNLTVTLLSDSRGTVAENFVRVVAESEYGETNACFWGIKKISDSSCYTYCITGKENMEMRSSANSVIKYITFFRAENLKIIHAGRYTLAVDNSKVYQPAVRLYLSSISVPRNANYTMGENCVKAFLSQDGRYIAKVLDTNEIQFFFTGFDRMSQTAFKKTFPIPSGKTIKRIDIVENVALIVFNEAGSKTIELPFLADKLYITYFTPGFQARVKYKKTNLLGGENKTVTLDNEITLSFGGDS